MSDKLPLPFSSFALIKYFGNGILLLALGEKIKIKIV
jgi:hypothetical protein